MRSCIPSFLGVLTAGLLMTAAPVPLKAQQTDLKRVTATNMDGVAKTLRDAGYDIEVVERVEGENSAYINIDTGTGQIGVIFSDCNDAVPDFCETLILSTWWERDTPISDRAIVAGNYNNKYVSVFRRDDGNPGMQWAILTRREGVPSTLFLNALHRFAGIARDFRDVAFQKETTSEAEALDDTSEEEEDADA